ncbi:MAG: spore cortex-lytic protein [Evtepia sp.]
MAELGNLITWTYTGRAQIPLQWATISVLKKTPNGKVSLFAVRITDKDGKIKPMSIPTPNIDNSLSPGKTPAFAICDILVEHPNYRILLIENVQVFADTTSLQELLLIPLPEGGSETSTMDVVRITPQDL